MPVPVPVRIDKWLWSIRLYKTRGLASEACRTGRVTIGGKTVKASREVKIHDLVIARIGQLTRTVKVLGLLDRRVGASMVAEYAEDLTPASEYQKPREPVLPPIFFRPKGAGRPTKKERRALGEFGGWNGLSTNTPD